MLQFEALSFISSNYFFPLLNSYASNIVSAHQTGINSLYFFF